jgi:hypothetical protein
MMGKDAGRVLDWVGFPDIAAAARLLSRTATERRATDSSRGDGRSQDVRGRRTGRFDGAGTDPDQSQRLVLTLTRAAGDGVRMEFLERTAQPQMEREALTKDDSWLGGLLKQASAYSP